MIMDNSKNTSKTTLLKLMLLRAWKERWTDCQWGINVKTVLTRGVSGDVYNLADAIIQQAVVGSGANMLFLSYLKHSLCAHLISHAAVLNRIGKYEHLDKHHCLIALLDFLQCIIDGVTCRSKQEEALITKAIVSLVHWLLQIYESVLKTYAEKRVLSCEEEEVIKKVVVVLERIAENSFLLGVISIGKCEDLELFMTLQKRFSGINNLTLSSGYVAQAVGSGQKNVTVTDYMRKLVQLEVDVLEVKLFDGGNVEPITYSMQPLIAIEVLLNPLCDTAVYVAQFINLKRLKGYSNARLYCEIMRGCLISLNNVEGTSKESLICAFAFIKVPHIVRQIHAKTNGKEMQDEAANAPYSVDVVEAFELLLQDAPVLDYMDMKCACNVVECLLKEMAKHGLVAESHVKHFVALREPTTLGLQKLEAGNNQLTLMLKFVFRVESPLAGMLKALSADYSKVQDALLAMLCQVLTGNSLDLVLSVASVEGKFKAFIAGLLKCNDYAKQATTVELGKASATRGALFDVTFMILACIAQSYGSDVILAEGGNSFFEKWVRDFMVEKKKTKAPMNMVKQADPVVLEKLIMALNNAEAGGDLKAANLRWEDVCFTIPALLHQVLLAWENDTFAPMKVKKMLDGLKTHFCAFAVCASSWLCAYMHAARPDEQVKPMNMVQQLCSAPSGPQAEEWQQQDYCKERFGLMGQLIRRMQQDFQRSPQANPKLRALFPNQLHVVSHLPAEEQFEDAWKAVVERGWLPIETIFLLDTLLQSCGPVWLMEKLVGKLFLCKYIRDLNKTVDIIFAIMHLDIERCTIALLTQLVPMMLLSGKQTGPEIVDPLSRVLAKLCVYAIIVTMEASLTTTKKRPRVSGAGNGTGAPDGLEDSLESLCSSAKLRKLDLDGMGVGCDGTTGTVGNEFGALDVAALDGAVGGFAMEPTVTPAVTIREPLQGCLQTLFRTFTQHVACDELSPKVYFIFQFLSLLVESGRERIMCVLKLIPNGLVQNLLKINVTDEMTVGFILRPTHVANPAQELAVILCSSGTTGRSKGVCLSHSVCIAHTCNIFRGTENDRVLCFSSLYWVSGLAILLTATLTGATRIITRRPFSARLAIDLVEQHRITLLFIPPTQGLAILADQTLAMADFSSLQFVLCGGGSVSDELKCSFERYLPRGGRFVVGYGLSELGGGGFTTAHLYKPGAIGQPNARVEAKVVDEEGRPLGCDQEGELLIRPQFAFLEYYRNPTETAAMLDGDGWLHTGDLARYDTDGVFFVVDRKKDIIKYAGYQIAPTELEETIMRLFGGSLLLNVCVTGIPVPGNDLPVALAIRRPGVTVQAKHIIDALAERVADFKQLRGGLFFVERLPMTPSGKIQRRHCRQMALDLYNGVPRDEQ